MRLFSISFAGALAAAMLASAAITAQSQEITLRGASCFPIGSPPSRPYEAVVDEINERGKGIVQVNMIGGAPAIGSFLEIARKTAQGAYDILGCTEVYMGNVIPEAPVLRLAEYSYAALRRNGGLQMVSDLLAAQNIHYVGRHHDFGPFHLWLHRDHPIDKPDLSGLNLRVAPVYTAFFTELGATTQTAPLPQIYQLMDKKTVQGYGWPAAGWVPTWTEVTGYKVEPGFYSAPLHTMFNLDAWNDLSPEAQKIVTDVVLEFEAKSDPDGPALAAALAAADEFRAGKGMEVIRFEGAEAAFWVETANRTAWDEVLERSPVNGPILRELFTRPTN